jgi:hypothetical protein
MRSADLAEVVRRRYWREDDARVVVEAWRHADEPLTRFARRHGVGAHRVARWAARLGRPGSEPAVRFHRVQLARREESAASIEIELTSGRRVRVPRDFELADLRRVLEALGESATC